MNVTGWSRVWREHRRLQVDEGTGRVDVLRWTVVQDAGKATTRPGGRTTSGCSTRAWLNEEYIYTDEGNSIILVFLIIECQWHQTRPWLIVRLSKPNQTPVRVEGCWRGAGGPNDGCCWQRDH